MGDYFRPFQKPIARKEHRCIACGYPIAKGETYIVQSGYYEGRAFRNKFHDECAEELHECGDDVFIPGSIDPPERLISHKESHP